MDRLDFDIFVDSGCWWQKRDGRVGRGQKVSIITEIGKNRGEMKFRSCGSPLLGAQNNEQDRIVK